MYFGEFLLFLLIKIVYVLSMQTLGDLTNQISSGKQENEATDVDKRLNELNNKLRTLTKTLKTMHQKLSAHNSPSAGHYQLVSLLDRRVKKHEFNREPSGAPVLDSIEGQADELLHLLDSFCTEVEKLKSAEKTLVHKIVVLQLQEQCRGSIDTYDKIKKSLPTSSKFEQPTITPKKTTDVEPKTNPLRRIGAAFKKLFQRSG